MVSRKIYCEVIEGIVYDDRCLFKLSKVIENNKSCENCILHEVEKIKSCGAKKINRDTEKGKKPEIKRSHRVKKNIHLTCLRRGPEREVEPIKDTAQEAKHSYSIHTLISLLEKSERTIREWAEKGKIPAHKVGRKWHFSKEEMDRWLSERKGDTNRSQEIEDQKEAAMPLTQSFGDPDPDSNKERSNLPVVARVPGGLDHDESEEEKEKRKVALTAQIPKPRFVQGNQVEAEK